MAKKRITELATETTLKDGQYVAIDHATDGTKKYNIGAELTDLKEDLEQTTEALQTKAEIDGAYDNMTVGNAEQLVSTVFVEDSTPYKFRTTGGSVDVGDREYVDAIVGGTVAWNQLVSPIESISTNGVSIASSNGKFTITGTATGSGGRNSSWTNILPTIVESHKYIFIASFDSTGLNFFLSKVTDTSTNIPFGNSKQSNIINATFSGQAYFGANVSNGVTYDTSGYIILADLTLMFGSTIADYIYSLEQANAGAGVAWFKKLFPKDYYAYNAGELISVNGLQSHNMIGFNQWDEEWEIGLIDAATGENVSNPNYCRSKNYIQVLPNDYYFAPANKTIYVRVYDPTKAYVSYLQLTANGNRLLRVGSLLPNGGYIRIIWDGTTYNNDICINLSWDGERDGEYEPYIKHSYPLDDSLTLRGIPKLDSANQLYYDGDIYKADGTVTRKYDTIDLGTLNWVYDGDEIFRTNILTAKFIGLGICSKYQVVQVASWAQVGDKQMSFTNSQDQPILRIHDSSMGTDAATFKEAMSGVYLVYELATPTTETAESYNRTQICDDFGTEEFISDSIVPVGHETKYANNLRAKLEMAPNSPDGDGDYIVRQTNGENTYVLLEKELPTAPSTDGSYVLKCTVSNGTATYTWESEE